MTANSTANTMRRQESFGGGRWLKVIAGDGFSELLLLAGVRKNRGDFAFIGWKFPNLIPSSSTFFTGNRFFIRPR